MVYLPHILLAESNLPFALATAMTVWCWWRDHCGAGGVTITGLEVPKNPGPMEKVLPRFDLSTLININVFYGLWDQVSLQGRLRFIKFVDLRQSVIARYSERN